MKGCLLSSEIRFWPSPPILECFGRNERRDIFFTSEDRQVYLGLLRKYAGLYRTEGLGLCLMTNHVHLILRPQQADSLAGLMRG